MSALHILLLSLLSYYYMGATFLSSIKSNFFSFNGKGEKRLRGIFAKKSRVAFMAHIQNKNVT